MQHITTEESLELEASLPVSPTPRQIERLIPRQIQAEWGKTPIAYIPLGTFEWHGHHLPIGLDAIKAHELCIRAADITGGLVLPPIYYGTGGGHIGMPLTIMLDEATILKILKETLNRLRDFGVKVAVVFTGHFPLEQLEMVRSLSGPGTAPGMQVLALSDYYLPDPPFQPDHAAIFETSMMLGLDPKSVHLNQLPPMDKAPADANGGGSWGDHRYDEADPLYGIFGEDPRRVQPQAAQKLVESTVKWLASKSIQALEELHDDV